MYQAFSKERLEEYSGMQNFLVAHFQFAALKPSRLK